ncbi:Transcriptional regulator PerR [Phycisphaerales bacterium]|nr:Transcriptional regulator PerR [Phycisphaerales bacterium]
MNATPERIRELFHQHDLRCTHQRELVFAGLAGTKAHPTAEELYLNLHGQDPNISLATVYNTLDALSAVGLVRKVPGASGACRYDADTSQHVHISMGDGRVMDAPQDLSERLLAGLSLAVLHEIEDRLGISVSRINVQVIAHSRTLKDG